MIKSKSDYFAEGALLFADTAMIYSLFKLWFFINNAEDFGILFAPYTSLVLFVYCINVLLSKKCPYINAIYIFNVFAVLLSVFLGLFVITSPETNTSVLSYAFKAGIFAFSSFWAYAVCKNKMLPSQIVLHIEMAALLIFIFVFLKSTSSYSVLKFPVSLIYGISALIISLILKRTSARNSERTYGSRTLGASIIGAAVIVCAGMAFLVSYLFSNIVAKIIATGVKGGRGLIAILKEVIVAFFELLLMLFPADEEVYEFEMEVTQSISAELMKTETGINIMPYAAIAAGIAVIGLIVFFFIKNRGKLNRKISPHEESIETAEKTSIRLMLEKLKEKIKIIFLTINFRIKNRYTIKGLYWQMDDFGKRNSINRLSGESGYEYITRITSMDDIFTKEETLVLAQLAHVFSIFFYSKDADRHADKKFISKCRKIFKKRIPKDKRPVKAEM